MDNSNEYKKLKDERLLEKSVNISVQGKTQTKNSMGETAKRKLIIVCGVCTIFMIIEFVGGILANSVAIMTDAAHLLSDLSGFLISIFALYLSKFPADKNFSYGYHRAETIGALLSVFIIWILTVLLLAESIQKLVDNHHKVNGGIMLFTSSVGLIFNVIMAYILHSTDEGGCGHAHHHGDLGSLLINADSTKKIPHHDHHDIDDHHDHPHTHKFESESEYTISPPREKGRNIKIIEMDEIKNVKKISEENWENTEDEDKENNNQSDQISKYKQEHKQEVHQSHFHKPHDHKHYEEELSHLRHREKSTKSSIKHSILPILGNKNKSVNLKNITGNTYSVLDRSDFTLSPNQRKSQRASQNIRKRHSRLLHNLENYILSSESQCEHGSKRFHSREKYNKDISDCSYHGISHRHGKHQHNHNHLHHEHSHSHSQVKNNINVQAAMIHIIGDIIQSIGVIIAAIIVYVFPQFQIVDPLITIFFSVIVIFTTVPIIKQCLIVIMEGSPAEWDLDAIKKTILDIHGVDLILCIHSYSLSTDKNVLNLKVLSKHKYNSDNLLADIHYQLREYDIYHLNVEIQKPNENYIGNCNYSDDI